MLGTRIKLLREELGLKQEELAKKLAVSPSAIGMYERNLREPNNELILKFANFFNVSVDYLLGKSDIRNPDLKNKLFLIPIVGKVAAGQPILVEENIEGYLPIDPLMYHLTSPDGFFFLKIQGESMN